MKQEYMILGAALTLLLIAALIIVAAVYLTQMQPATTTTTTTTTTPTTTATTSTETTSTTNQVTSTTTSTTTTSLKQKLAIALSPYPVFKRDDVTVEVTSRGSPVDGVNVTVNYKDYLTNEDGVIQLYTLDDGNYTAKAEKPGYVTAFLNFSVDPLPYVLSKAVKTQHTTEERQQLIAEGKVVVRFYETPNCPNCLRMKPWVNAIANLNRECVSYESLNLIHDEAVADIKELYPDQLNVVTPVMIIEGPAGESTSAGFVPKSMIESRIISASDGRCPIIE